MAVINTNLVCDLQKTVKVEYIDGVLFSQDNQANKINVTVLDGGEPATISGTVSANIIRSDGGTVAATGGSITGNVASITLPAAAYAVPGVVSIVVKLTTSGVITTIAAIVGNMYRSSTDTAIDPGTVIPSIQTLISQINAAVASIPADYSSLWTKLAPAFSTSANYVAGQYATCNSGLYRFNTTHTGDWSSSDVTAVNIGGEITDLNGKIDSTEEELKGYLAVTNDRIYQNAVYAERKINENTAFGKDLEERVKTNEDKLFNTVELKDTMLVDNNGNELIDKDSNILIGKNWFIRTDPELKSDVFPTSAEKVGELKSEMHTLSAELFGAVGYTERKINEQETINNVVDEFINRIKNLFAYKRIPVTDNEGRHVLDKNFNELYGLSYMVDTDKTGTMTGFPMDAGYVGKTFLMQFETFGIPVMYLAHPDIESLLSKAQGDLKDVKCSFEYRGFRDVSLKKFKVQGASSESKPKKNYTITFKSPMCMNEKWGFHTKYVLKADWVDYSHIRNEVGAKIWGAIRKTRINPLREEIQDDEGNPLVDLNDNVLMGETLPCFAMGMNYGAIDAYPILLVINGVYWGIYSVSIPKDDWMAGFVGDNEHEAIISAEDRNATTYFKAPVTSINEDLEMFNGSTKVFDVEYLPDEDDYEWVMTSVNNMIEAIMTTHGGQEHAQEYIDGISPYIDVDSVIDYYIFSCLTDNWDGVGRNYLLDTWDGIKWYFAAYDIDNIFGFESVGTDYFRNYFRDPKSGLTFGSFAGLSRVMHIIYNYDKEALKTRYAYLRSTVLSEENIYQMVTNYASHIPYPAFNYELLRWPDLPASNVNKWEQVIDWYNYRCKYLDSVIENL